MKHFGDDQCSAVVGTHSRSATHTESMEHGKTFRCGRTSPKKSTSSMKKSRDPPGLPDLSSQLVFGLRRTIARRRTAVPALERCAGLADIVDDGEQGARRAQDGEDGEDDEERDGAQDAVEARDRAPTLPCGAQIESAGHPKMIGAPLKPPMSSCKSPKKGTAFEQSTDHAR